MFLTITRIQVAQRESVRMPLYLFHLLSTIHANIYLLCRSGLGFLTGWLENYNKMYGMHLQRVCFCKVDVYWRRKRDKWASLHIRNAAATKCSSERLDQRNGVLKSIRDSAYYTGATDEVVFQSRETSLSPSRPLISVYIQLLNCYLYLIRSTVHFIVL